MTREKLHSDWFNTFRLVSIVRSKLKAQYIFENIFTNALSGTVEVVDTANLPTNIPLTGKDFLELKLVKPGLEDEPIVNNVFCIIVFDTL